RPIRAARDAVDFRLNRDQARGESNGVVGMSGEPGISFEEQAEVEASSETRKISVFVEHNIVLALLFVAVVVGAISTFGLFHRLRPLPPRAPKVRAGAERH